MGTTPEGSHGTEKPDPDYSAMTIEKLMTMDAMLLAGLDRLAGDYHMSADTCLMELMRLRAEHEGPRAVAIMVEAATDLWSTFKMGSKSGAYWAMRRARREVEKAQQEDAALLRA